MQGVPTDGHKGNINVTVQPSTQIHPGIYCGVNDHYSVVDPDTVLGCNEMMDILRTCFYDSIAISDKIFGGLMERK